MPINNPHKSRWPGWLKAREASQYSALGIKKLKKLASEGEIVGGKDPISERGDWIFSKKSLDEFRRKNFDKVQSKVDLVVRDIENRLGR